MCYDWHNAMECYIKATNAVLKITDMSLGLAERKFQTHVSLILTCAGH